MMSYLWILLLGSLLASHATAQEDTAPEEDVAAADSDVPTEEVPVADGEGGAEQETEPTATEEQPAETGPESAEAEANGPAETGGDTEPDTPAGDETTEAEAEPEAEAEAEAEPEPEPETEPEPEPEPAVEDAEGGDPAGNDEPTPAVEETAEEVTPDMDAADQDAEVTPPADAEAEGSTTTVQVDIGAEDTVTEEPTDGTTVEDGNVPDGETTPATGVGVADVDTTTVNLMDHLLPTIKEEIALPEIHTDVGFNLEDALVDDNEVAKDTEQNSPPSKGKSRSSDHGKADAAEGGKPAAQEGGSGSLAGILSAIIVSAVGAVSGYFAYQKKKLCFKNRQEADPEAARKADAAEAQSDPQALNTLLNSS